MDIYVGHASSIRYRSELYQPIKESNLGEKHSIVLPHDKTEQPFESKDYLRNKCELFISEVSDASTGLGMEMGWAEEFDVPILCIHKEGEDISSSIPYIAREIESYSNRQELVDTIQSYVKKSEY